MIVSSHVEATKHIPGVASGTGAADLFKVVLKPWLAVHKQALFQALMVWMTIPQGMCLPARISVAALANRFAWLIGSFARSN